MKQASCLLRSAVCSFLLVSTVFLEAVPTFGSRQSAIRVRAGATFNASSSNLSVNGGTLAADPNAFITGNIIAFDDGVIDNDVVEFLVTGSYDPSDPDLVILPGNGRCRATPGTIIQDLEVQQKNNRLEGQPIFVNPVLLQDSDAQLIVSLQNGLNRDVIMNGGNVVLDGNLFLRDGVKLIGPGVVDFNNCQLSLGGTYASPWTDALYWRNATDIALNGYTALTSIWTFSGVSVLNGNGCVLDLNGGGQLVVDAGSTLLLNDIHINGIGNGDTNGKIRCADGSGKIVIANSSVKLDADFTTSQGNILVNGPTTFLLRNRNWTFDQTGSLTVDGVSLWIDSLDLSCPASNGTVYAPLPLGLTGNSNTNLLANLAGSNFSLLNSGSVKLLVNGSDFDNLADQCLFDLPLTDTLVLDCDVCLCADQFIRVAANICIDGQGSTICFNKRRQAQLTVEAGKILTLKNVALVNISQDVIDLRPGARIHILNDVCFGLSENITFSNGLLRVLESPDPNIFRIFGQDCRRGFEVRPLVPLLPNGSLRKIFHVRTNTVQLESVALGGFGHISHINGPDVVGAVALSCNAAAHIDVDTGMNFFVEGVDNDMVLQTDGINLSGNIAFGDLAANELTLSFALSLPINPSNPARADVRGDNPFFTLSGDSGMLLTSELGNAHLIIAALGATVKNANNNGFIIDQNSWLTANSLQILTNPIKQQSASFRLEIAELTGQKIDPSFIRSMIDGLVPLETRSVAPSALAKKQHKDRAEYEKLQELAIEQDAKEHGAPARPKAKQDRALQEPAAYDQVLFNQILYLVTPVSNNIQLKQSELNNFTVQAGTAFTITMEGETSRPSIIDQSAQKAELKGGQIINVRGHNNVIRVNNEMIFTQDTLLFDKNAPAELTIEFVNDGNNSPVVRFNKDPLRSHTATVLLEKHSTLRFKGEGTVIWGDGTIIHMNGQATALPNPLKVTARPTLELADRAVMTLASPATVHVRGIGELLIQSAASLQLTHAATLLFGSDVAVAGFERQENFVVTVDNDGSIVVQTPDARAFAPTARMSFLYAAVQFNLLSGVMQIGTGGLVEFNANNGTLTPGWLQEFNICNGSICIDKDGRLRFGPNKLKSGGQAYEQIMTCLALGRFGGTGMVEYKDTAHPERNLLGQISSFAGLLCQTGEAGLDTDRLVFKLIQQCPKEEKTLVYIDENGKYKIRFQTGPSTFVVVAVKDGHTILCLTPRSDGSILAIDEAGNYVLYTAKGCVILNPLP